MLFENLQSRQRSVDPRRLADASLLRDYFSTNKRHPGRYDQRQWARKLQSVWDSVGEERYRTTLTYLLQFHQGKPTVGSVNEFSNCFEWLSRLAEGQSRKGTVPGDSPDTLADEIANLNWPVPVRGTVPTLGQSRTFVQTLADAVPKLLASRPKSARSDDRAYTEALTTLAKWLKHPDAVLREWFRFVCEDVSGWAKWSGNLSGYALSFDHALFPRFWSDLLLCRGGDRVIARVKEAVHAG